MPHAGACLLLAAILGMGTPLESHRGEPPPAGFEAVGYGCSDDAPVSFGDRNAWHEAGAELFVHLRPSSRSLPEPLRSPADTLRMYRSREADALAVAAIGVRQRAVLEHETADRPTLVTMPVCGPPARA